MHSQKECYQKMARHSRESGKWKKKIFKRNRHVHITTLTAAESCSEMMLVEWTLLATHQVYYLKWDPWDTLPSLDFFLSNYLMQHTMTSAQGSLHVLRVPFRCILLRSCLFHYFCFRFLLIQLPKNFMVMIWFGINFLDKAQNMQQ